jgi:hypothetical protein
MKTRELASSEWAVFFDCFSRRFRGRPVTLELSETADARGDALARRMPLIGLTVEPHNGPAESITVMVGDSPSENVVHVVRSPCRVRVAQVTNGEDEVLIIDSGSGPTTRIDFRHQAVDASTPAIGRL